MLFVCLFAVLLLLLLCEYVRACVRACVCVSAYVCVRTVCLCLHFGFSSRGSVGNYGCVDFFSFFTFFNTFLLQKYIHGAPEDMRHWYTEQFISHINMEWMNILDNERWIHIRKPHMLKIIHMYGLYDTSLLRTLAGKKRFVRLPPGRETRTWAAHLSIIFLYFVSV